MENDWENYLISLPDDTFFDILRNFLGNIKTPFNKHDLIRRLNVLISNKENRDRIFDLIDDDDSRVLTAITILDNPDVEKIFSLTKHFYSFIELHNRLENLQQRLLICIFKNSNNKNVITLSPIFKEEITSTIIGTNLLFPSISIQPIQKYPWLRERIISAFLSFISSATGSKRKIEYSFDNVFNLLDDIPSAEKIDFLKKQIVVLEFAKIENDSVKEIFWNNLNNFAEMKKTKRYIVFMASAISAYLGNIKISQSIMLFTTIFLNETRNAMRFHIDEFVIFVNLLKINTEKEGSSLPSVGKIIDALLFCGFVVKDENYIIICKDKEESEDSAITVQANFEIIIPSNVPFYVEAIIAGCCELVKFDVQNNYELTKSSFSSALDSGLTADFLMDNIKKASDKEIPQNIIFTLQAWKKEYVGISLHYGVVLSVDKNRNALIEHCEELKKYIITRPSSGVYLLDHTKEEEWRKILKKIGFDIVPATKGNVYKQKNKDYNLDEDIYMDKFSKIFYEKSRETQFQRITEELLSKVQKMNLKKELRLQIEAKIRKKLILNHTFLTKLNTIEEIREAGGIDHRAKIRLAESAINFGHLLEINVINNLEIEQRLIKPEKLIKKSSSPEKADFFTIEGLELPSEEKVFIPITRISYIKMLKNSLFSP